jgi:hypothetical protein
VLVVSLEAWVDSKLAAALAALQVAASVAAAIAQRRRVPDDARGREGLWLLAALLVAATAPLALQRHALTVALAAIGLLLVRGEMILLARRMGLVGLAALGWSVARALEVRWLDTLPAQWFGRTVDAVPFVRLPVLVEALVLGAAVALGLLRAPWRAHAQLAAAALAVPIVAGETMGALVAARWPHSAPDFCRAIAWAWPLAVAAAWLAWPAREPLRAYGAIAFAVLTAPPVLFGTS